MSVERTFIDTHLPFPIARLWAIAHHVPVELVPIQHFVRIFTEHYWENGVTPMSVMQSGIPADHARRISCADLSYPLIVAPNFDVLDGIHRLCRAWTTGVQLVPVQVVSIGRMQAHAIQSST